MATNTNETEAKYDAPTEVALPGLNHLPAVAGTSGPDEERLEAEYYDTTDLRRMPVEQVIGPVQARVQGHFAKPQATAREAVLAALDSPRYFSLLDELDRLLADPPLTERAATPADGALPAAVRRGYRKVARRMRRAQHAPAGEPRNVALHQARKAAKRAHYAGEAVTPAIGTRAARFTRQMKKLQSALGDHQDTVIARRAERELGVSAHLAGENAFTYGLLFELDASDAQRLQVRAHGAWKRASRYRRWMG